MDDDQQSRDHDVLQHGTPEHGRLETLAASRPARLTAVVAVVLAGTGWLLLGPGMPGAPNPGAPGSGATTTASGADPSLDVPTGGSEHHECESERSGAAARAAARVAAARPAGVADRDSRALVRTMRRFAAAPGADAGVPWAPRVVVLGEGPVAVDRVVAAKQADRRATWTDPSYLLARLAVTRPARLRVDDETHLSCRGRFRAEAAGFEGQRWVSVQPRLRGNGCRSWWAVDVYLDYKGRVEAILTRS